ncbi:hypothetical protein MFMK1_002593 [Metallumcola ferriviriculae]|uniref:protein-tyrosine-phosphatase n=1 Tax=Metallumcola ferriviriculae TaxID=3039180 RepID=A0AAU0UR98_9FIRM|nr:hypothetical protein MFMK1_002593 [Desulfitibacteraceae bacterium MK1]
MIDIHCHILPGIDDGAKDIDTAVEMLRIAAADGIKEIITTPHYEDIRYHPTKAEIAAKLELIRPEAEKLGITLYPGMEVYLTPETPRDLKEGRLNTLAGSKYLLVEFPFQEIPPYADKVIFEIMLQGIIPVIAHPERNGGIIAYPNCLVKLLDKGVLTQVNGGSLLGCFGQEVGSCAKKLVKHGMVHFLSSDAHSDKRRTPLLSEAVDKLKEIAGADTAARLLKNSQKLLNNETITSSHQPITRKAALITSLLRRINVF